MLSVGQILDERYEILAPLAEGGMGAVYRARRVLLGDEVAIKIVRADHTGPGPVERFMRESRVCAQMRHPNIVTIFDFNADDLERPFLVMELLSGPSLRTELARSGPMGLDEVQAIVPPICSALRLAHEREIVHRDLKPANIVAHDFTSEDRVYKIVDFGIANIRDTTDTTRLTAAHEFIGTLTYASPEQLAGAEVDFRSDIYSLGAVVYEMLTGRVPFGGDDVRTVLTGHLTAPAPRPGAVRPGLPSWIDDAVLRALAKRPEDRWSDIGEFGRVLSSDSRRVSTTRTAAAPAAGLEGLLATYELGERLGPGRLGSEVYRGTHRALGHPVAIRVLCGGDQQRAAAVRARFLAEARTLQIAHPSIINVRDYGESGDAVYVVTDFIEGPRLRDVIAESAPLPWNRLQPLVAQLVEAAQVLHRRKGLISGLTPDIMLLRPATGDEPEQLMISTAGIWEARDLLATLSEQTLRGMDLADRELRYVAPEILTGRAADAQSDIFTMGILAYEMATGRLPYDGRSMPELLGNMLRGAPEHVGSMAPTLPESAAAAIMRAINPSSEQRFATVREFVADLGS